MSNTSTIQFIGIIFNWLYQFIVAHSTSWQSDWNTSQGCLVRIYLAMQFNFSPWCLIWINYLPSKNGYGFPYCCKHRSNSMVCRYHWVCFQSTIFCSTQEEEESRQNVSNRCIQVFALARNTMVRQNYLHPSRLDDSSYIVRD